MHNVALPELTNIMFGLEIINNNKNFYGHVLEQTLGSNLVRHFRKKAHAFAKIWIRDSDHNPERTHALGRSAMALCCKFLGY